MTWAPWRVRMRGFSLVELSVSLVVAGLVGLLLWRWTAATQEPATLQAMYDELAEVQVAVEGFVLANNRLPCPASSTAGTADCGNPAAVLVPWRSLGLPSRAGRLHYGVNQGGGVDLAAVPAASVSSDLGLDFSGVPTLAVPAAGAASAAAAAAEVTAAITEASALRSAVNGLDWCAVIDRFALNLSAAGTLLAGNDTAAMPVAYVLVHPGRNDQFDGNNVVGASGTWRYDLPGRAQNSQFDDLSMAVGPADLGGRLGCVGKASAARAAAQAAFAQYDTTRVVQEYWSLRVFDIQTAEEDVSGAETGIIMAAMDLTLATAAAATGLASAANTEGLTAYAVVIEAINLGLASEAVVTAAEELTAAQAALVASRAKLLAANAYVAQTYTTLAQTIRAANALDRKGLNP